MKFRKSAALLAAAFTVAGLTACGSDSDAPSGDSASSSTGIKGAVIGFAQVGSESGWRSANTDSIKAAAAKYGVDLKFTSAEGDQTKQIASIKTFITQVVDVIAF